MLGGLATEEGAPRPPAPFDHSFDQRGDPRGVDPADREVVEEEERLGAGAHDVVGAHRHEVDPHRVEPSGQPGDLQLRPDAVGRRREQPLLVDPVQAGEPSDLVCDLGAPRRGGEVGDQGHGLRRGLGIDPGVAVRAAHAVGSWS